MKVNFDREEQELVLVALNNLEEHYRTVYYKEGNYYCLKQISKLIALKKKLHSPYWSQNEEYVNRVDFEYNTEDKY